MCAVHYPHPLDGTETTNPVIHSRCCLLETASYCRCGKLLLGQWSNLSQLNMQNYIAKHQLRTLMVEKKEKTSQVF